MVAPVCCCYDYRVDAWLQNYMVHCILRVIRCIMSDACHTEWEYPQDGGCRKKAASLNTNAHLSTFLLFPQGLCVDDQVVEFGSVSTANFKSLHDIGTVVKHSQGVSGSGTNGLLQLKPIHPLWKIYCMFCTGECEFQMDKLILQLNLKPTHPLCYMFVKSTTEGVKIIMWNCPLSFVMARVKIPIWCFVSPELCSEKRLLYVITFSIHTCSMSCGSMYI